MPKKKAVLRRASGGITLEEAVAAVRVFPSPPPVLTFRAADVTSIRPDRAAVQGTAVGVRWFGAGGGVQLPRGMTVEVVDRDDSPGQDGARYDIVRAGTQTWRVEAGVLLAAARPRPSKPAPASSVSEPAPLPLAAAGASG